MVVNGYSEVEFSRALFLILLFVFLFSVFAKHELTGGDYPDHFAMAQGTCDKYECDIYAPLFGWIASPFAFHETAFLFFVILLVGGVTPLLLYFLARDWLIVLLFYATGYFWFLADGILAQALAGILLVCLLLSKDYKIDFVLLLLLILAHGHGFLLGLIVLLCKHFTIVIVNGFPKFFLACSGVFGMNRPELLNEPIQIGSKKLVSTGINFTVGNALIVLKILPFPFIVGLWEYWHTKENLELLVLFFALLIAGFMVSHRIFYFLPLTLLVGTTRYVRRLTGNYLISAYVLILLLFGFQVYAFFNNKFTCVEG